jgi:hypothetical protein
MVRVEQDLVAPLALDVRDEADAAAVVLELREIQALSRRQAVARVFTHIRRSSTAVSENRPILGREPPPTIETRLP